MTPYARTIVRRVAQAVYPAVARRFPAVFGAAPFDALAPIVHEWLVECAAAGIREGLLAIREPSEGMKRAVADREIGQTGSFQAMLDALAKELAE